MSFNKIATSSLLFLEELKISENKEEIILRHLSDCEDHNVVVPEFEKGLEWFNAASQQEPLKLHGNLKGKIALLDFFTYCCVNCMHVLPDLHAVEKEYTIEDGVVVIGVHSAKFDNEKLSSNIQSAIQRYGITHAVVNDSEAVLWHEMGIQCWPTFVILSPEGKVILYMVGEGHREALLHFLKVAVEFYKGKDLLHNHSLPIALNNEHSQKTTLSFPGKICLAGKDLAISDTGNHRVLVVSKDGLVKHSFGGLEPGWHDSTSLHSKFNAPQGITFWNGCLYVADTENHVIRKIDLERDAVSTIAGTGKQGADKEGGKKGEAQDISSPWDITVGAFPGKHENDEDGALYIAMAGSHQIWAHFLTDGPWLKGGKQESSTCIRFAGSGNEENRNNSYPHKASFAQPSGITIATVNNKKFIYVADSESSCVRSIELSSGAVKACVGGERDPMNLFAYGDKDGKGIEAKLQHPLAVVWNPSDCLVYVADSYNHKVKYVDPVTCTCKTLAGTGEPGFHDGDISEAQFNEPGGLEISEDGKLLYVTDTNNNCIRIINLERKTVQKLEIRYPDNTDAATGVPTADKQQKPKPKKRLVSKNAPVFDLEAVKVNMDLPIELEIEIALPERCHHSADVENMFAVIIENPDDEQVEELSSGTMDGDGRILTSFGINRSSRCNLTLLVDALVYFCSETGVCLMKSFTLKQNMVHEDSIKINTVFKYNQNLKL